MPIPHVTPTGGLSPRTRGSPPDRHQRGRHEGSIPAHAGEPSGSASTRTSRRVYPRARGGASPCPKRESHGLGLSPRTRGSHERQPPGRPTSGSIPAHAGEPYIRSHTKGVEQVYPRARGGAVGGSSPASTMYGLSPRTRGSLIFDPTPKASSRSIPAHAGEPSEARARRAPCTVYPRARGGALYSIPHQRRRAGLSPRTRGSRRRLEPGEHHVRSIPAHAGEPPSSTSPRDTRKVYPRARGGAVAEVNSFALIVGLSPRTRGSRRLPPSASASPRSIPAHAGEPECRYPTSLQQGVYPRARGGALRIGINADVTKGLSPRTRGSRCRGKQLRLDRGSIPAHAGEPPAAALSLSLAEVYPRARGGA